jgi:hypothetical protein
MRYIHIVLPVILFIFLLLIFKNKVGSAWVGRVGIKGGRGKNKNKIII